MGLVVALAIVGVVMLGLLVTLALVWVAWEANAPLPDKPQVIKAQNMPEVRFEHFPDPVVPQNIVENLLPFVEQPPPGFAPPPFLQPPREPFRAEGPLVTLDLKAKINWLRDQAIDLGGNDMGNMPMGEQTFAGIKFNVQGGAILLGGRPEPPSGRPLEVGGIPVMAKCKRLYAFHTAHYAIGAKAEIGGYKLRYEDGQTTTLPIVFSEDVSDWFFGSMPPVERARIGWTGRNGASDITFYVSRYENPHPAKTIASIDVYATNAGAAPACVALTIEQ